MKKFDVYAIGNALVDSEYQVSEALLQQSGVEKRHMTLIDAPRRAELLQHMHDVASHRTGGGSAGNTIVAVAQFGGKAFYSCRVAEDELGAFYTQDLAHHGVATNLSHTRAPHGQTGICMVMVTPDAERSMSTFLGATADLDHTALHPQDIERSRVYYMEGYLAASPTGVDAALQGRAIAHRAGVALALTLSDMSMINFCRPGLEAMVGNEEAGRLEYLFCNEEEAQVWCGSQDLEAVCAQISKLARVVCLTRSAKGCIVLEGGAAHRSARRARKGPGQQWCGRYVCWRIPVRRDPRLWPCAGRSPRQSRGGACGRPIWQPFEQRRGSGSDGGF
jgi:sugar/nucleoside kinase (ribokinase family)